MRVRIASARFSKLGCLGASRPRRRELRDSARTVAPPLRQERQRGGEAVLASSIPWHHKIGRCWFLVRSVTFKQVWSHSGHRKRRTTRLAAMGFGARGNREHAGSSDNSSARLSYVLHRGYGRRDDDHFGRRKAGLHVQL